MVHETDIYGKMGQLATRPICDKHELVRYVQSGEAKTVADVLERSADAAWPKTHLGYRVNTRQWSIAGVTPNSLSGQTNDDTNKRLGEIIAASHGKAKITIIATVVHRTRATKKS